MVPFSIIFVGEFCVTIYNKFASWVYNLLIYNTLYKFLLVHDLNRFPMR